MLKSKEKYVIHQICVKCCFDNNSVWEKSFDVGGLVLKWDTSHEDKSKHSKFQTLSIGPFTIEVNLSHNTLRLRSLDGSIGPLPLNDQDLKHYLQ